MSTTYVPYWEKLKDPRWQRRRLEVMQNDNFTCRDCGNQSTTLNVHHVYYIKGRDPWDYPDQCLKTLCEPCHKRRHELQSEMDYVMSLLGLESLQQLLGYAKGWALKFRGHAFSVAGHDEAFGAVDALVSRPIAYIANLPGDYPVSSEALEEATKEVDDVMLPVMAYLPELPRKDVANG